MKKYISEISLVQEWDYEKNTIPPGEVSKGSHKKVWWKCKKNHSYLMIVKQRAISGQSCPYCMRRRPIVGETDLGTIFPWSLEIWDYEKNSKTPQDFLPKSGKKAHWKCKRGHEHYSVIRNKVRSNGNCKQCFYQDSSLETTVVSYLKEFYEGRIVRNSRPLRNQGKLLEIDILLPKIGIGFEIQDFSTHSKDSDSEKSFFPGLRFKKGPEYHDVKRRIAKENGILLIDIWEDEIKNNDYKAKILSIMR